MTSRLSQTGIRLKMLGLAGSMALIHGCSDTPTSPADGATPPAGVTANAIAYNRIRLQWPQVETASGYVIERRQELTGAFTPLEEIVAPTGATADYIDDDVEPETFYGYRIATIGRLGGRSSFSEVVGARTLAAPGIEVGVVISGPQGADPNGFRVVVSGPSGNFTENVSPGTNVQLAPLSPGEYSVRLEDVAPSCGVQGGVAKSISVPTQGGFAPASFNVSCRDASRGGVIVSVSATGDTIDANGVVARVVGTAGGGSSVQETLAVGPGQTVTTQLFGFLNLAPGPYEVSLLDLNTSICSVVGSPIQARSVQAGQNVTVSYQVSCLQNLPPHAEANGPYGAGIGVPMRLGFDRLRRHNRDLRVGVRRRTVWEWRDLAARVLRPRHLHGHVDRHRRHRCHSHRYRIGDDHPGICLA
jgi:hypothetical protein